MFGITIQIFDKCQVLIVRDTVVAAVQDLTRKKLSFDSNQESWKRL